jgi:hypothetical protein
METNRVKSKKKPQMLKFHHFKKVKSTLSSQSTQSSRFEEEIDFEEDKFSIFHKTNMIFKLIKVNPESSQASIPSLLDY